MPSSDMHQSKDGHITHYISQCKFEINYNFPFFHINKYENLGIYMIIVQSKKLLTDIKMRVSIGSMIHKPLI